MTPRPLIVPVFIPHAGCPQRCVFCNQSALTAGALPPAPDADWIEPTRQLLKSRCRRDLIEIAFFGGNFLGLPQERIRSLLAGAAELIRAGEADGIRFSTRPDTVSEGLLDLLAAFPVRTVELGAQSMDDEVLRQSGRGHSAADTQTAVERLRRRGYAVGLQLMVGLPGDDAGRLLATGRAVAALRPACVRIYPTLVLAGSELESWYRRGRYRPLSVEDAVAQTVPLYRLLRQRGISVIRTGIQPTDELALSGQVVAGPYHPAFGQLVQSACFLGAARGALQKNSRRRGGALVLRVHPRDVATMRGQRNANCRVLREEFGFQEVRVAADPALDRDAIGLSDGERVGVYTYARVETGDTGCRMLDAGCWIMNSPAWKRS